MSDNNENFNYADMFNSSGVKDYISYMNEHYMNLTAPTVKVFKLDKNATILEDLYGSEKHSRVFLPPFDMRMNMLDNPWKGVLNIEPYIEEEDNTKFVVNFNAMVRKHRELRFKRNSDIFLKFAGSGVPSAKKLGNIFTLYVDSVEVVSYDMTDGNFNTTKKLVQKINTVPYFSAELNGVNDPSSDIVDFDRTAFTDSKLNIYTLDPTYQNITDVIEMGDAILTSKYRIYQVLNANPTGDFGWNYATYTLDCNLYELDMLDGLPGDYRSEIEKRQYGLRKVKHE